MIPVCEPYLNGREVEYVNDALKDNWISSSGKYLDQLEERFAAYCGVKYGVAVTSGTTALHLALAVIGVKDGDEVIMPTFTIYSCPLSVAYCGGTPVFVDSDPNTFNMDVNQIEALITEKTRAIMPVHIYGKPVDMDKIIKLALDYDLYVIEDAAEAHGAEYRGKKVGSMGHIGCFSFYSNKIITTGEGGILVTNSKGLANTARKYKNLCHTATRFIHNDIGFNYRMTNIQAAIGLAQLEHIDEYINIRLRHAKIYSQLLSGIKQITIPVDSRNYVKNINWMFCILVSDYTERRNLMEYLDKNGIQTRTFFYPMHQQYKFYEYKRYPIAEKISNSGLYLPSGTGLKDEQIEYVCNKVKEFYNENKINQ